MAKEILPKIAFINNAKTYKLLANEKRLEILNNIKYEEKRVDELVKILGVSKANVSQHLALLRHAGIVETRRDGQNIYYRIIAPRLLSRALFSIICGSPERERKECFLPADKG